MQKQVTWTSNLGKLHRQVKSENQMLLLLKTICNRELRALEFVVSGYLDFCRNQANRNNYDHEDWATHLDRILNGQLNMNCLQIQALFLRSGT